MRTTPILALLAALAAPAWAVTPPRAVCDGAHESLLEAMPALPTAYAEARAAWLDDHRLRWAGAPRDARYALVSSRRAQLALAPGEPVRGADSTLALDVVARPAETPAIKRFSHIGDGATLAVRAHDRPRLRELHRGQVMLVRLDAQQRVLAATAVQHAGALDALYAAAERVSDLGAVPRRNGTSFKLWAPTAQAVSLCLYESGAAPAASVRAMRRDARTGVWSARLPSDQSGHYHAYLVDVFVRGKGLVRNLVTDPYALSLSTDSKRATIADLDAPTLKPPGWDATPTPPRVAHPVDMVIYELHVRDFSAGDASVPTAHRGKYLAFTHEKSLGMQHLARLSEGGVTDIHFLPIFDLATVPEQGCSTPSVPAAAPDSDAQQAAVMKQAQTDCFNWGYDPFHFTAPEGSFATDAADGAVRIRELRAMVQALHRANLRVGMDMVYNHTTASGQHARSVLDRIVPGYYHRLDDKGGVTNSTCCDNTATEHAMMAKLMIDSAVVWARDYKIDSFRFDLMGHQPRAAMERLSKAVNAATGRRIDLIGEGWNFGEVENGKRFVQAAQRSLNGSGIGSFSDRARDAARGSGWGSPDDTLRNKGWIHGLLDDRTAQQADLLRVGLAGTVESVVMTDRTGARVPLGRVDYNGQGAGFASQPSEVVNYTENHDNQTLFDNNVTKLPPGTSPEDRARVQVLGAAVVAFSQGIAYLHAGQEILRSKSLDRNSYDSGDWFNRLDWSLTDNGFGAGLPPARDNQEHWRVMQPLLAASASIKPGKAQIEWTRDAVLDLLRIRASTPLLRLRSADEISRHLTFHNTGPAQNPLVVVGEVAAPVRPEVSKGERARSPFGRVLYAINAAPSAQTVNVSAGSWKLHPVHLARQAADARIAREASIDAASGKLVVPARSAVVFVQ